MKFVSPTVTRAVASRVLVLQKHSPAILFGAGIVGFVATTVLSSRATLKLADVLDSVDADITMAKDFRDSPEQMFKDYNEEEYKKDAAVIYARATIDVAQLYAPAIVVGAIAITCLTKSHNILSRRNAALTAAYAALEKGFTEYRKRVSDTYGEDIEHQLRYGSPTEMVQGKDGELVPAPNSRAGFDGKSVYARVFDELNVNWNDNPGYNLTFITIQQNRANDILDARGHIFLNEVYDMLGLPRCDYGQVVGWVRNNGDSFVDFGVDPNTQIGRDFLNGYVQPLWLDFNVDGVVWNLI